MKIVLIWPCDLKQQISKDKGDTFRSDDSNSLLQEM